jgi:hypothetical protein
MPGLVPGIRRKPGPTSAVDTGFRRYDKKERPVGKLPDHEITSTLISPHWHGINRARLAMARKPGDSAFVVGVYNLQASFCC